MSIYALFGFSAVFLVCFLFVNNELRNASYYVLEKKQDWNAKCDDKYLPEPTGTGSSIRQPALECFKEGYGEPKESHLFLPQYISGSLSTDVGESRTINGEYFYVERHLVYAYDILGISILLSLIGGLCVVGRNREV